MSRIAFLYSSTKLTDLAFSNAASNQYKFEAAVLTRPIESTSKVSGDNLNGSGYYHVKFSKKERDVTISADELDDTKCAFFNNWFKAKFAYISIYNGTSWSNYIRVRTTDGRVPISFIDGINDLPELSFTIFYLSKND